MPLSDATQPEMYFRTSWNSWKPMPGTQPNERMV
jgi:hypothetical protein